MRIGHHFNVECTPLKIVGVALKYVTNTIIKYLGVCLVAGTHCKCSVDHLKVKFYRVLLIAFFPEVKLHNLKLFQLNYSSNSCLLFLLYGFEAVDLSASNIGVLDICLNRAVYRIVGVCPESPWQLKECLGLLSIRSLIEKRKERFFDCTSSNVNYNMMFDMIWLLHVMLCNLLS